MNLPKYPRTKHWPASQTVQPDDSILDNPEAFLNRELVILEKLDGGNTCLYNGEVYARSVSQPCHHGWMSMVRKHHAWKTMNFNAIFYGEDIYGVHSIEYGPVPEEETFYLFSTLTSSGNPCEKEKKFNTWHLTAWYATQLEVPTVPVIAIKSFETIDSITAFLEEELKKESALGGPREGFVVRSSWMFNYSDFDNNVFKYVRPNHVQTDEHWTKNWQPCRLKK
jgi:hypothetical protein